MNKKRILAFFLALFMILGIFPSGQVFADPSDLPTDWSMPPEGTYEIKNQLKKLQINYDGSTDNTLEFTLSYQSTVHPINIHYIDMKLDPRLVEHVAKIDGKSKQYFGIETQVDFIPMYTQQNQGILYYKDVYRVRLGGADGLFTGVPWGAEVYEAKIIIHLNKKVTQLPEDVMYTIQTRGIGTSDDNIKSKVKYIDGITLNSGTFVKLKDAVPTKDSRGWLKNNSTMLVSYESGGTLTTNYKNPEKGDDREPSKWGHGVMRIKYYIYPKMLLTDSYTSLLDQYKHYSMAIQLEDKLIDLIPDDARIRVNAVRRIGTAYNHLEVGKDQIVRDPGLEGGELRLSVYGKDTRNNPDKTAPTDPIINNPNMYIPVDADGALPTYVQIEIPIDETKAPNIFEYNQYNIQAYYYNKIGRLVDKSLARSFTNGAKTTNSPSIVEGSALLYGDEVKGTAEQKGAQIYIVSAKNDPANFTKDGLLKPGVGRLIGQGTADEISFVTKTFPKEGTTGSDSVNRFVDIINENTGENFKEGEHIYVFQSVPGRMMSYGTPVELVAKQTHTPIINDVKGNYKQLTQGYSLVTGTVEKNDPTADITLNMKVYRGGKIVDGKRVGGTLIKQKGRTPFDVTVSASDFDAEYNQNGYINQNGEKNYLVINRDGSYKYYKKNSQLQTVENNGGILKGDIIEVVATEKNNKPSEIAVFQVEEDSKGSKSLPPVVFPVHPTVPDEGDKGEDSYLNKASGSIKFEAAGEWVKKTIRTEVHKKDGTIKKLNDVTSWGDGEVPIPNDLELVPGDKIYVSQIVPPYEESEPTIVVVTADPKEYYYYELEIILEGKGLVETIQVHKKDQAYPDETGQDILPSVQASNAQLPLPQQLITYLEEVGVAQSYLFNSKKSTQFSVTPTKDFDAFWEKIKGNDLTEANRAAHKQNKYTLYFGRNSKYWGQLQFNAGAYGYFDTSNITVPKGKEEDFKVKADNLTYSAIKFNETKWADVKNETGLTDEKIIPIANPGYKFINYLDQNKESITMTDDRVFDKSLELVAQYAIDQNQKFGYEIQYVYDTGKLDTEGNPILEPVPGKDPVKGEAPIETVVEVNQDPIDGFKVMANQPKEFSVNYIEENGQNNNATNGEPTIRQIVKVVYESSKSETPVITTDPVMDTTEVVEGTAAPYAGLKLYYAKNIAAQGEPENWVADTSVLLGETTTTKEGTWKVSVSDLTANKKIIAVAKDPLKVEVNSAPKDVIEDTNKFEGKIVIQGEPAPKNDDQVVSGTIEITPKPGETSPSLEGVVVKIISVNPDTLKETLIGKSIADAEGKFNVAVNPKLIAGHKIIAEAQPKKTNLLKGEATVAVNTDRLDKDIVDGEEFLNRSDIGNFDVKKVDELRTAIAKGKKLVEDLGKPDNNVTQGDVEKAADDIEKALKALNVNTAPFIDASDRVLDVGDEFDPLAGVKVIDSQEQIDNTKLQVESNVPVKTENGKTVTTKVTTETEKYTVKFTVTDSGGLKAEKIINVTVRENDKAALKVAINKGENVLADGKQYDPIQVEKLKKAIADAKKVDENPNATKTEIQNAKDAINTTLTEIAGNVQKSNTPLVDKVRNGDVLVGGKLVDAQNTPIANAEITIKDKNTGEVLGIAKTDTTGAYSASVPALKDAQILQVTAVEKGKIASDAVEKTVVPNTDKLNKTITKADDYVAKNPLVPGDPVDDKLQAALDKAKDIKNKAEQEPPTATQDQVDKAQEELEAALNAKKDKVTAETNIPSIDEPINNGAISVTGKAAPGADVTIYFPNNTKSEVKADPTTGVYKFENISPALQGGDKIQVTATVDGVESEPAEATVVTDVAKLKDAISKGEKAAEGLDSNTVDPEDRELLDAIAAGKDILENPLDPNSPAKPGKTQKQADDAAERILNAIKAKEEADKNDANSVLTPKPEVEPIANGATKVTGKAAPGSKVTIYFPNKTKAEVDADPTTGVYTFEKISPVLQGGEKISVSAKLPNRPESEKVQVTVITDVNDLKKAIGEGEEAIKKANTPPTAEDTELKNAIDAGKALIVDPTAEPPVAKENVTQGEADAAAKRIRDAIKAKEKKDAEDLTAAEKEAKRQELIDKLKAAIKRGEDFKKEPTYKDVLPEDKAVLDRALEEAKKDLVELEKPDWNLIPNEAKVDKDIEDIDKAIANARKVSVSPKVDPIKHNTNIISGKEGNPGDTITVTLPDGFTKDVVVESNGTWSVTSPKPLLSGEVVKAQVTKSANPKLGPSEETTVTVGLDTAGLQESYDKATPIVNDPTNFKPDNSNTDKDLQEAYQNAADVLEKAKDPVNNITQDKVDQAKKKLDDALVAKEKFEEAKKAVDTAKTTPSKETIAKAQEKIDAMDGSIIPTDPNYNKDKADLQKELDKVKLQEAIEEANEKLKDPTLDPTDKKAIEDAKGKVEKDLVDLNDGNPATDPSHKDVVDDIKNLEDAINGAKNQTGDPSIVELKKGDTIVKGTAEVGATVIIKLNDVEVGTVVAKDGNYSLTLTKPLVDKDVIKAVAQSPGKTPSNEVEAVVGVYKADLEKAIQDGNQALIDNPNTPPTKADNKLQDAINKGEIVKNDPNSTQEAVDKATQDIRDALDQKAAEDAVKALEDKQKAKDPSNPITPEEIKDAQDKIDKLPGNVDEGTPEFNPDKKELQDRLDKVKAVEEIKDLVEKADEILNDKEKIKDKPAEVVEKVKEAKAEGETVLVDSGATTEIEKLVEIIKNLKQALDEIEKEAVDALIVQPVAGNETIYIRTKPANATITVYVDGVEIITTTTNSFGYAAVSVKALKSGQRVLVKASAQGFLDNKSKVSVR